MEIIERDAGVRVETIALMALIAPLGAGVAVALAGSGVAFGFHRDSSRSIRSASLLAMRSMTRPGSW
jgi:hypothetical protein